MAEDKQGARPSRKQAISRQTQRRHPRFYELFAHWSFPRTDHMQPLQWYRERWVLATTALLIATLAGFIMPTWASAMRPAPTAQIRTTLPLTLPALPATARQPQPAAEHWRKVRVKAGQTLSDIFQAQGLGFSDLNRVLQASSNSEVLHQIHPGDEFSFLIAPDGGLLGMRFDRDAMHRVQLNFDGTKVSKQVVARTMQRRERIGHGIIHGSLFGAAERAGMSDAMVMKLADVFKYDIDLAREVHAGDSFTVIYDGVWRDGVYLHSGNILAAEFYNRGRRLTAFRFQKPDGSFGYYSEDGRPLQKALLRTPLKFSRISSRFGMRMDPVLHSRHLHAGVDLAAPTGTPIHAAGNGVISIRGWVRGYDRYIRIRDTPAYSTGYGHMSRFAPGLHVGSHVRQGQIIGYVGQTGWATGPHLHYEVRIHGKPVNPLTVTMPKPRPLAPKLLAQFHSETAPLLARLKIVNTNIKLAQAAAVRTDTNG